MTVEDVRLKIEELGKGFEFENLSIFLVNPYSEEENEFQIDFTMDIDNMDEYSYEIADHLCKRQFGKSIEDCTEEELDKLEISLEDKELYQEIFEDFEEQAQEKAQDQHEWSDFDDSADIAYDAWKDAHSEW